MIYSVKNRKIFFRFRNKRIGKKNKGMVNQILENKYLNETKGIELVMLVMKIQKRYKSTAILIGWTSILLSNIALLIFFKMIIKSRIIIKGSYGRERLNGIVGTSHSRLMDKAVVNTAKK